MFFDTVIKQCAYFTRISRLLFHVGAIEIDSLVELVHERINIYLEICGVVSIVLLSIALCLMEMISQH